MASQQIAFDAGPLTGKQRRIGTTALGGYFVDGYDLLVLSGALLAIVPEFGLAPAEVGFVVATAFFAMALGSAISGPLTDRFGRRPIFFATMILFAVASLATLGVSALWQLIVLRFLVGLAIGGDMPPSAALLTEFIPRRRRGTFAALGGVAWTAGGALAIFVTLTLFLVSDGPEPWRLALASGAVPAAVLLFFRHKTPESPYWLIEQGRADEAVASWQYASESTAAEVRDAVGFATEPAMPGQSGFRALFGKPFGLLVGCVAVYWFFNNLYGSAIVLYQPTLIARLLNDPGTYTPLIFTVVFQVLAVVFGLAVCLYLIETIGRRAVALGATALVGLGGLVVYVGVSSVPLTLVAFGVMIVLLNGGSSLVFYVWAPELFPTRIRGRAVGVINMFGKGASVVSTLTLPSLYANVGNAIFLLISAAAATNIAVVWFLAPETKGRSLADLESGASRRDQMRAKRSARASARASAGADLESGARR